MLLSRREFGCTALGIVAISAAGCGLEPEAPTAPSQAPSSSATTTSLLSAVRATGYPNAQVKPYGNGAAQIAIDGHTNWNFLVNGQPVGIGNGNQPNLNVPAMQIPGNAQLVVRHI